MPRVEKSGISKKALWFGWFHQELTPPRFILDEIDRKKTAKPAAAKPRKRA